jgi:PAS domain S-box-containing protein
MPSLSRLSRYGFALLSIMLALFITALLLPAEQRDTFILLLAAVALSSLYGGLGPGLFATLLGALGSSYFLLAPTRSLQVYRPEDTVRLVLYLLTALLISFLASRHKMSQAKLQEAITALRESETQLRLITNGLPALIAYVDKERRYQFVNQTYSSWFGHRLEDVQGKYVWEVLGNAAYEAIKGEMDRALAGQAVRYERLMPYKDGPPRFVLANLIPDLSQTGQVRGFFSLIEDISERRQAEARLRHLSEASTFLASSLDLEVTLHNAAHALVPQFADWCVIDLLEEGGGIKAAAFAHAEPDKIRWAKELRERYPVDPKAQAGAPNVIRTGKSEFYPEIPDALLRAAAKNEEELALLRSVGYSSVMVVPLLVRGRTIGAVTLVMTESGRHFNQADLTLAEELARRCAAAIDNARLFQAEQQARALAEVRTRRVASLQTVTAKLANALTPKDIISIVFEEGLASFGASGSVFALLNEAGNEFEIVEATGYPEASTSSWQRFPLQAGLPMADVVLSGQPLFFCSRKEVSSVYGGLLAGSQSQHEAWTVLPLLGKSQALGAVSISFAEPQNFSTEEREFIVAVVSQCSQALERSLAFERERRARQESERLQTLSARLATSLTPADVVAAVLEEGLFVLGSNAGSVVRLDGDMLEIVGSRGFQEALIQPWQRFPLSVATPLAEAARTGETIWLESPEAFYKRYGRLPEPAALAMSQSWVALPLRIGERVLGSIGLSYPDKRTFDSENRRFAEILASLCAQALERALLFEKVQNSERALREADKRKDEFLAVLAHELRNPLAPIRTSLEIMKRTQDEALLEEARDIVERQTAQMVHLIDDLLDVSRITRGKIVLKKEHLFLTDIVTMAVESNHELITDRGHNLGLVLPPEPVVLYGDKTRLVQIISNLLTNAAKYTSPGGTIQLSAEPRGGEVVISVQDNGIGIPKDMLGKVFEMFTRVERQESYQQQGLGIGLSLVKQLVELHGGTVTVSSEGEGKGSTFTVRLPASEVKQKMRRLPTATTSSLGSRRVLVVDDYEPNLKTLSRMLRLMGHEVATAKNGEETLECLDVFKPEVILLDINMPGMSGYEVAARIKKLPQYQNITLIALTGYGHETDRQRAKKAGFHHHLVKPVEVKRLEEVLAAPEQA